MFESFDEQMKRLKIKKSDWQYFKDKYYKMTKAQESFDKEALQDLGKNVIIFAKVRGYRIPTFISDIIDGEKIELDGEFVRHDKYSILPWVKQAQMEKYDNNLRYAERLSDRMIYSTPDSIIEEYKSEISRFINGRSQLDTARLKMIEDKYEDLWRTAHGHKRSTMFYRPHMKDCDKILFTDFSSKSKVQLSQASEALELIDIAQGYLSLYGSSRYAFESEYVKREEEVSAKARMDYLDKQFEAIRKSDVKKPLITKWLTDRYSECAFALQKPIREYSEGRMSDMIRKTDDQLRWEEERKEKQKADERAEALRKSANIDNGLPPETW